MSRIRGLIASMVGLLVSAVAVPTSATIVTFGFEGPVAAPGGDTYIRGQITYDSDTAGRVDLGTNNPIRQFDRGDALVYDGAVRSISFATENISRSYDFGDARVLNDFEPCVHLRNDSCIQWGTEPDELRFYLDYEDPLQEFVIVGRDQTLLSSGALPDRIPTEGLERVELYWQEISADGGSLLSIVGNSLRIVPAAIPEPGTVGLLIVALLGFGTGPWLRQTRSESNGSDEHRRWPERRVMIRRAACELRG